jgi:hypothetical protein
VVLQIQEAELAVVVDLIHQVEQVEVELLE